MHPDYPDEAAFFQLIQNGREEIKEEPEFQSEGWQWIYELDDEGFYIFCYLVHDYHEGLLTTETFENTVYTLAMLRKKFIPESLKDEYGISIQLQLQLLFTLYEKLKKQNMPWSDCQHFIDEQIQVLRMQSN